jgi:hypothetical protein
MLVRPNLTDNFQRLIMKIQVIGLFAALLSASLFAHAAPPQFITIDNSNTVLIDAAGAKAMWKEVLPAARLAKLYSPRKWGFASVVQGGFNPAKICVITARAMMLPVRGTGLDFKPAKMATAFDALPNASEQQCDDLARSKLKEAMQALVSSLVAT